MQPAPEGDKLYSKLSEVPLLPGHQTFMVMGDAAMLECWDGLLADPAAMQQAHIALADRILEYFKQENLLDEVSGIAATEVNCVWLNCSLRAWERAHTELGLQHWANSRIHPTGGEQPAG